MNSIFCRTCDIFLSKNDLTSKKDDDKDKNDSDFIKIDIIKTVTSDKKKTKAGSPSKKKEKQKDQLEGKYALAANKLFLWCFHKIIPSIESGDNISKHDMNIFKMRIDDLGYHIFGKSIYYEDYKGEVDEGDYRKK
jgi:hypothetical protein